FQDELIAAFLTQRVGFNSPVWFNYGLFSEYGISGNGERRRYYYDYDAGEIRETRSELERPSGAACYLSGVSDSLFTEEESGMADLLANEQKIFLTGAGDGVNISDIRGTGEPISGGGQSSGLITYLKVRDAAAGYIRSGGRTRRSATLLCCELDHPDILDFIEWKEREELKAHALLEKGFSGGMEGEAYSTVSGQNSNNSVRVSNAFMEAVEQGQTWYLLSRVPLERFPGHPETALSTGHAVPQGQLWLDEAGQAVALTRRDETVRRRIMGTLSAPDLWTRICETAWRCGCPGVQFDDLINDWNTVPHYGRIRTTNPCAEICLPDWSVCNLGSINLIRFFGDLENPDWDGFRHAVRLMTIALDLVVDLSSYPTRRHAEGSMRIRSIGLNHGNIGAVLMRNGLAYDSDEGRFWMEAITSFMTLESSRTSLDLAALMGSYPEFRYEAHRRVLNMHRDALDGDQSKDSLARRFPAALFGQLRDAWKELCESPALEEHGLRNNTVTTIPPQGTIGLVLDQDTLGCEPEFCLIKQKTLAGGGSMVLVNQSVRPALRHLGYSETDIEAVCEYVQRYGTVEGCDTLRDPAHLAVFDTAVRPANTLDPECGARLRHESHRGEALRAIAGARCREEAVRCLPDHLRYLADHVKVFTRSISVEGHVRALAAIQPHLSHSISKTCNMDAEATVEDVSQAYKLAHTLGVKCIAIYRDGSKKAQPLQAGVAMDVPAATHPVRGKKDGWTPDAWPAVKRATPHHTANCDLFHFRIADPTESQGVFVNAALYPDSDDLMAVFVNTGRQGETTNGLVHSLARVISCALQHGVPPEEIGRKLAGMSFPPHGFLGDTSAFGIHRAKSVSDLIGRLLIALPDYYRAGRDPSLMHPRYDSPVSLALESEDAE
ncbi:MAG: adenosylcobalamin-dependent ribonucleoside-diphosphate reductase, partial [Gemmatimonadetes bacterium]|nr:adenosylcobalamin-dependent ribonucleoside-diphosphate reductase [Gemmatimonadota bacterium]